MSAVLAHRAVLLREAVEALAIKPSGLYVDGTFGRGGHSRAILERLGPDGRLLALDRDPQAVAAARQISDRRLIVEHRPFAELGDAVRQAGFGSVDGVLLDRRCLHRRSMRGRGGSVFALMRRWICAWIPRRGDGSVVSGAGRY